MITVIEGRNASLLGNSMRNTHIGSGVEEDGVPRGFLLVNAGETAEPRHLLEKLIHGAALPADGTPVPFDKIPWKHSPQIAFLGAQPDLLAEFERLVPGLVAALGPVETLQVG